MERHSSRSGFSLIDALATLVIAGILLALALPAIQASLGQSRAAACTNNLQQISLALQNYHDVYKLFPAGGMHAGKAGENERMGPAWWYGVLPFLEARNQYDKIQSTQRPGQAAMPFNAKGVDAALGKEVLSGFKPDWLHCPASPLPVMETRTGPIALPTYVGIAGGCDIRGDSPDYQAAAGTAPGLAGPKTTRVYNNRAKGTAPFGGIMASSGMLPPCQGLGIQNCTDGTTYTMIVGEQGDWLRDTDGSQPTKYHGDAGWDPQGTAGTGPRDGGGFLSGTVATTQVPKVDPVGAAAAKWDGDCYNLTTVRYRPNLKRALGARPLPGCSDDHGVNNPLQSAHPGGAFVAMTDGSVQFISATTDLGVLLRLAIRDDGQNVSLNENAADANPGMPRMDGPANSTPFAMPGMGGPVNAAPPSEALQAAIQQVQLYPRDPYLQYAALQLARRENHLDLVLPTFGPQRMAGRGLQQGRAEGVDLFTLFSGALAVQESLQLDTMLGNGQRRGPGPEDEERVAIGTLTGPTIESHPWEKMLGNKKPDISPLALCVPEDFYFVEFRSLSKLLDLADHTDLWSTHLFSQSQHEARTQLVGDRVKRQLALETNDLLRPFYDLVVEEVGATGSDLFLREGSDVTILFRFRQPAVFQARMEQFLAQAEKSQPQARRSQGECLGVPFEHVTSPDRTVHVFAAYPQPNLYVRSNSRVGFERVLAAIRGQDAKGQAVARLGDTKEFAFIRTLMPRGAAEEDGFIYLSDPFIRRLVGPQVKLTEQRRMLCYNHLRMIGHASLLYRTERGKAPESLAELTTAKCAPGEFGKDDLVCPDSGQYTLSADGAGGVCSHHGRPQYLTPCCEIPLKDVGQAEAEAYEQFLTAYNQFWRTFFDPIAIRVQVTPQRYRAETIVLPLIDNSIYTNLAKAVGAKPEPLDSLPVPKRNIFSVSLQLNKAHLLREFGLEAHLAETDGGPAAAAAQIDTSTAAQILRQLALSWHNYHDVYKCFPSTTIEHAGLKPGLSWRVRILPFIEQKSLYDKFHLNEPWDSEHNRKLVAEMPALYRPANKQLAAAGKTRFVSPRGEKTISPKEAKKISLSDITDGTSNTIMLAETDDEHAVVWTQPDDLEIDLQKPAAGLAVRPPGGLLFAFADGSLHFLRSTMAPAKLAALFTRAGGEPISMEADDDLAFQGGPRRSLFFGAADEVLRSLEVGKLLSKGIGNRIGLHVCDSEPVFDFSLPRMLGLSLGTFQGRGPGDQFMLIGGVLISALNSPIYISLPVQDAKVVDEFLVRLDGFLVQVARQGLGREAEMFGVSQDYYQLPAGDAVTRSYGFRFGPIKWRFFWARIGDGLYVATQPFILEDLAALQASPAAKPDATREGVGHAMVRIRPQNWQRVLPSYQLGWAENNREACLNNVGPLSSLARAYSQATAGKSPDRIHAGLVKLGERFYDSHLFCPDGGQYQLAADGKAVVCSLHGTASAPRQQTTPAAASELGRLLHDFADLTLTLTFLEDGLHAVATIDRQPRK